MQYFTPRPLISAIVERIQPQPSEVILDPALRSDDERREPPIKTDDALSNEPSSHADV